MQTLKYRMTGPTVWDSDNESMQGFVDKINRLTDGTPEQKTLIADADDFDVPDADHNNERWDPGFIVGGVPAIGSADIDTTVPDTSNLNLGDGAGVAVTAMYAVRKHEMIDVRSFVAKTDMPDTGCGPQNADTYQGIMISRGVAYDANNFVQLIYRYDDVAPFIGLEARATIAGVAQPTVQVPITAATLGGSMAFMILRTDHVFELWYSDGFLNPNERWTKIAYFEDPADAFGKDTSYYEIAYGSKVGGMPDTFNVMANFQKFRLYFPGGALADLLSGGARQYGVRSLFEQFGNEAMNRPWNFIYRFPDGYNAGAGELLWHRNGILQDLTGGMYTETDDRTITIVKGMLDADRMLGISISEDIGKGGLACVDRPPPGAGQGPYTVSGLFSDEVELFVYLNGVLQLEGAGNNYIADLANNQFTFEAGTVIWPIDTIIAVVVRRGEQGQVFRERQVIGACPLALPIANTIDRDQETTLVYLNGVLLHETFEHNIVTPTDINILAVAAAPNDIEIVSIRNSQPPQWRQ